MTAHPLLEKWNMLQVIIARPDISSTAKVIAARLLDHLNSASGRCFPSYDTLGKGIGMSRRTAMKAVKELERKGIVVVRRRSAADAKAKGWGSNYFDSDWTMVGAAPMGAGSRSTPDVLFDTPPGDGDFTLNHEDISREYRKINGMDSAGVGDSVNGDENSKLSKLKKDSRHQAREIVVDAIAAAMRRLNHTSSERIAAIARTIISAPTTGKLSPESSDGQAVEALISQQLNGTLPPGSVAAVAHQLSRPMW
jgi:Helix-turn-helix domain